MEVSSSLLQVLENKVLPWAQQGESTRLLIAPATRREFILHNDPLPIGVTSSSFALRGRRKAVHGSRPHDNRSTTSAVWPEDKLVAPRLPIIICPFEGQMDFRVGDYFIHSNSGHFILLPPDVPRDDGTSPHLLLPRRSKGREERCSLFWLRSSEQGLECWMCHSEGERHWGGTFESHLYVLHREAHSYFLTLTEEAQSGAMNWQTIARGLLLSLVSILHRGLATGHFYGRGQMGQTPPKIAPLDDPIVYAQHFIREHLNEPLTIDRVAHVVYLARTQFTTRFREQTGQSFTEYLTQCRLEKAQTLLKDTKIAVRVVAHLVGVQPSHLRRLFVRYLGMAPEEYRSTINHATFARRQKSSIRLRNVQKER